MRRSDYQTTRKEFSQSNAWMLPDLLQILNDKTARGGHSFGSYSKAYCRPPDPSDLVPHRGSLCILVAYLSPSRLRRNREAVLEWTNLAISRVAVRPDPSARHGSRGVRSSSEYPAKPRQRELPHRRTDVADLLRSNQLKPVYHGEHGLTLHILNGYSCYQVQDGLPHIPRRLPELDLNELLFCRN